MRWRVSGRVSRRANLHGWSFAHRAPASNVLLERFRLRMRMTNMDMGRHGQRKRCRWCRVLGAELWRLKRERSLMHCNRCTRARRQHASAARMVARRVGEFVRLQSRRRFRERQCGRQRVRVAPIAIIDVGTSADAMGGRLMRPYGARRVCF